MPGKKTQGKVSNITIIERERRHGCTKLKDYFFSGQVGPLINLCNKDYHARWKDIELSLMKDPPFMAVLGNKDLEKFVNKLQNPWTKFQIKTWNSIKDT